MKKSKLLKKCLFFFCIIAVLMVVVSIVVKYEVEGEKTLPYKLSKIFIISTVEGNPADDGENIWNINIKQVNDLYFYVDKERDTEETIKRITIENFNVTQKPAKGELTLYRPTGDLGALYKYSEQNYLAESLTYTGAALDDLKSLEIGNRGGVFACRMSLNNLGTFISNDTTEINYDGSLLQNIGVNIDEIKFGISFDILIETNKNIIYKGTISINLPAQDIIEKGSSNFEITDFSNVIFKRL